jgi:hypothetical protein
LSSAGPREPSKRRFGAKSALDYLVGEKLPTFVDAVKDHSEFAAELPRFLSAIYGVFKSVRDRRLRRHAQTAGSQGTSAASPD